MHIYLVSYPTTPLGHGGYRILVDILTALSYSVDNGGVGLETVEGLYGILFEWVSEMIT
jgi:hypothetical protein